MNKNIYIALSGGGYRATLYHLGVLRRLCELGLWEKIHTISSVSGGSILNGLVGIHYDDIKCVDDFDRLITTPLLHFTGLNVRNRILGRKILQGIIKLIAMATPLIGFEGIGNAESFSKLLDNNLLKGKTLDQLCSGCRIVINSTNMATGVRFRFEKMDFGDYTTGYCYDTKNVKISEAVASSAAFPLLFYPLGLSTKDRDFYFRNNLKEDKDLNGTIAKEIYLTDGGVYENLGYQALHHSLKHDDGEKFVIVSDASGGLPIENDFSSFSQLKRTTDILFEKNLKDQRREFVPKLMNGELDGCYVWLKNTTRYTIQRSESKNGVKDEGLHESEVKLVRNIRTDLDSFSVVEQDALQFHGESSLDTNLKAHCPSLYKGLNASKLRRPKFSSEEYLNGLKESHKQKILK
ncbi:patatin-like phospholipase family protein [Marinifilum flexuosum]|uniref:patatin-like phospholipase family protein n=1 Tax=Marinifilum flexuosum TaxID=1117708 RepID=UPI00249160C9|nr:patatin-like phospholipase family protein [Marinifilum flexuosum]